MCEVTGQRVLGHGYAHSVPCRLHRLSRRRSRRQYTTRWRVPEDMGTAHKTNGSSGVQRQRHTMVNVAVGLLYGTYMPSR